MHVHVHVHVQIYVNCVMRVNMPIQWSDIYQSTKFCFSTLSSYYDMKVETEEQQQQQQ